MSRYFEVYAAELADFGGLLIFLTINAAAPGKKRQAVPYRLTHLPKKKPPGFQGAIHSSTQTNVLRLDNVTTSGRCTPTL